MYLAHARLRGAERYRHPDCRVDLITVRIRREAQIVFRDPAEIAEAGGPIVAGTGVDPGEVHSHTETLRHALPTGVTACGSAA